ncbi:MAG TPA: DUF1415 domain-containing protein [Flavisolibacter sp.]|nr:DUF1415 domain-containing protein [Flavisolibacter sp.]
MAEAEIIIEQTKKWIVDVVVGCNFCPFAAPVVKAGAIHYEVFENADARTALVALANAFTLLDTNEQIETMFLIFPNSFDSFDKYLGLVELAEAFLADQGQDGIYQVASFHPAYLFEGSSEDDPSNYTNRSPYPMLHLLREESVSRAIDSFPGTQKIPQRNIQFTRQKGIVYMRSLWESAFKA